jgi:hypothetical protein
MKLVSNFGNQNIDNQTEKHEILYSFNLYRTCWMQIFKQWAQ